MCLKTRDQATIKPACSKARKIVYKVVRMHPDGSYRNLFSRFMNNKPVDCFYHDNVLTVSNRQEQLKNHYENFEINYGFHCLLNLKDAKRMVRYMVKRAREQSKNDDNDTAPFYRDYKFAVIKCSVDPMEHVADGVFELDTEYGHTGFVSRSAVYDKLTPLGVVKGEIHDIY